MKTTLGIAVAGALLFATAAFAASPGTDEVTQRDANQQERIEQGLQGS